MDFIDKFAKKVSESSKNLSKKTDKILELTEIKIDIKNIEDQIRENKMYIGELVCKNFDCYGKLPLSDIYEKCKEIQRMYQKINLLKERINKIKGLQYCTFCGESIDKYENYCSNCGKKIIR
jgi:hypothetical protein